MVEKKKILYIVEAMGGGVFTYIVDLANELVNKYDMYIAYALRKQTPKNYKDYFDKRVHLIEVKNFGRTINPTKDIAAFFEVKKIAAAVQPDVIHLHSSKAGAIGRIAFDGKIPMFYTPHGYSFLMENYKPMKRKLFKLIESVCAKRNCTTISCSVGENQETLKFTRRAIYVNNGINMSELQEIIDKTERVQHPFTVYTLGKIAIRRIRRYSMRLLNLFQILNLSGSEMENFGENLKVRISKLQDGLIEQPQFNMQSTQMCSCFRAGGRVFLSHCWNLCI